MTRSKLSALAVAGVLLGASPALADGAGDEKSIEQAKKLLLEAGKAYARTPALTDEMELTFSMKGMPEQTSTAKIRMTKEAAEATGVADSLDIRVIDGDLIVTFVNADGIVRASLGDDPLAAAKGAMGMAAMYLPPQFAMRWVNEKNLDSVGDYFSFGMLQTPKITGYEKVEVDGVSLHEIQLTGSNMLADGTAATCRIRIDTKTSLLANVEITGGMDGVDETVTIGAKFKPEKHARLEKPIAFDAGDAKEFQSLDAMMAASMGDVNPGIEVGTKAPTFELVDQDGKKHSSEMYAGKIMMLDWWGVW